MNDTPLRLTLVDAKEWTGADGQHCRHEKWAISGGEIDPAWSRKTNSLGHNLGPHEAGWEPSSRFTLWIVDGKVSARIGSYGGVVWPTAWPKLFQAVRQRTYQAGVEITDEGLRLREAALHGASCADADARLL